MVVLSLSENLDYQARSAQTRVAGMKHFGGFLASSAIAGAFVGLGVLFMLTAGGPLKAAGHPAAQLIAGSVFGVGLVLVVFSGVQLLTSAMMVFPIGLWRRTITWSAALRGIAFMYLGNLLGSVVLAGVIVGSGMARPGTPVGDYLAVAAHHKVHHTTIELLLLGVLCNIFVCLAVWGAAATDNAAAKVLVIGWCVAAFVASGTEHVVANMTLLSAALMQGAEGVTLGNALWNQLWVFLGNGIGGALFIAVPLLLAAPTAQPQASVKSAT